jgi:hypothetical protein
VYKENRNKIGTIWLNGGKSRGYMVNNECEKALFPVKIIFPGVWCWDKEKLKKKC